MAEKTSEKMPEATAPTPQFLSLYLQIKKLQIWVALKRSSFSGRLTWTTAQDRQWVFFFDQGNLLYGTGGAHPIRQWYRQVQAHAPALNLDYPTLQALIWECQGDRPDIPWDYALLCQWLHQNKLSEAQFSAISQAVILDSLFDIVQAPETNYQLSREPLSGLQNLPPCLDGVAFLSPVAARWNAWLEAGLMGYSPNAAPVIAQPAPIQNRVSPQVFQSLMQLLDGQRSLRDLALKLGQDLLALTQSLRPYIAEGLVALVEIADYPLLLGDRPTPGGSPGRAIAPHIACIDDSPMVCRSMGQVIRSAGYEYMSILEGAKAIPTLLAHPPDLIFLDLVMPDTSGYEICSHLRKISRFKETPIVILSGSDGLVDQVRARLLGATDFLSKPIEPIVILAVIQKHLRHYAVAHS